MPEELHIRLPDEDAKAIRRLVRNGEFSSITEAARFAIKQFLRSFRFASEIESSLQSRQRDFLRKAIQPAKEETTTNFALIREKTRKYEETDKWVYTFGTYRKKQIFREIDRLISKLAE